MIDLLKKFAVFFLLIGLAFPAHALDLGARAMGMGGAFTGLADDVSAIVANPAGLTAINRESSLIASRVSTDRQSSFIGGVETTPIGNFGIAYVSSTDQASIGSLDFSEFTSENVVSYSSQTVYLSYANELNKVIRAPSSLGVLSYGVNLKLSSRKFNTSQGLAQDAGSNVDVDLATMFKPNDNLALGMSVQNMMSSEKANQGGGLSAIDGKAGVLMGISGKLLGGGLVWSADTEQLGCEWRPSDGLALRLGRDKESVTSGLGVNYRGFSVDYACVRKEGLVHYVSVAIAPFNSDAGTKQANLPVE
ncbi:MAG: hypothetical protein KKC80_07930 [Candidatus Margulisbacteria bacterium]|nr:hypothetical protein [Candidatus Margulisiibacteriota bacterium]MBU1616656.1 hypothetical protein [Candidatus Margulisiibacteriota bacterium]MBU1867645.1 hypothetical protein [Candidatus Margulisiibacteriota bacterium]